MAEVLRPWPGPRDRGALHATARACDEVVECSAAACVMQLLSSSSDTAARAAAICVAHVMCVHGGGRARDALVQRHDIILHLVDASKLEGAPLPQLALQPPPCTPATLGQAAAEALAALAADRDAWRRQVFAQVGPFLESSSTALASSACHVLAAAVGDSAAGAEALCEAGAVGPLVGLIQRAASGSGHGTPGSKQAQGTAADAAAQSQGQQQQHEALAGRAVQLLLVLCRGGGAAATAAVDARGVPALLQLVAAAPGRPADLRVTAAAALGHLLRKSDGARDQAMAAGGLPLLLELARSAPADTPLWEDAMGALAAQAGLHAPSHAAAAQALRQMLVRGGRGEAAAAALVVARMTTGAAGREAALGEELVEPLVRLLAAGAWWRGGRAAGVAVVPCPGRPCPRGHPLGVQRGARGGCLALCGHPCAGA